MNELIHVSVAWPYANGDLHIGHIAGAYLPADIFARYHRLQGNRVLMVSGSDSHGTPIMVTADQQDKTPREVFEHYHTRFLQTQKDIGISYDLFTHTDTESHHRIAQDFFKILLDGESLYLQSQKLLYDEEAGRFLPDRLVEGTCPVCGYEQARGDQCDEHGGLLDALELINPRSKLTGSTPVVRESEHYFLDLPAFTEQLLTYIDDKEHWRPQVINFTRNYLEQGLQGRPITRDIDWGIPVPLDGWDGKALYVWFEAVMGYFTASVEWAHNTGQPEAWKDWWYDPAARIYNFIGKDNIPFHTLIWQAELLGVGRIYEDDPHKTLNLPYDVPANEFMNVEGRPFSKSRNWAVWLPDILERYDPDTIRYYTAAVAPETRDADFSWDDFVARNNNELVAAWGNLVNRTLSLTHKNFDSAVPDPGDLRPQDEEILAKVEAGFEQVGDLLAAVKLRAALEAAMELARETNRYLDQQAPWSEVKTDKAQAAKTLYTALRVIDNLKLLLAPFLPFSAERLHKMLGYEGQLFGEQHIVTYDEASRSHAALTYDGSKASGRWAASALPAGQKLGQQSPLFKKLDDSLIEEERARLGS